MNFDYAAETEQLLSEIGAKEARRLFSYELCEVEPDFVGFLENYAELQSLPKDFTIIDIGSYQSFQAHYFIDHEQYIGVEPCVPLEWRLRQGNAVYFQETGQEFIAKTLNLLIKNGLDLNRTFAVCSAVPDRELQVLVSDTFPYHKVAYPALETVAHYPKEFGKNKTVKIETYEM